MVRCKKLAPSWFSFSLIRIAGLAAVPWLLGLAAVSAQEKQPPVAPAVAAEKPAKTAAEDAEILAMTRNYAAAYTQNDAKLVASYWAEKGVYIDPETGTSIEGREKIEAAFAKNFASEKGTSLQVAVQSIRGISPDVAEVAGIAVVSVPGGVSSESSFVAMLVKQAGGWKIDSVRESETAVPVSNYERLADLEWMVGEWKEEAGETKIFTRCRWIANRNFLLRSFTVMQGEEVQLAGTQIIGYDASIGTMRSWVFDTDGGFGEGVWATTKGESGEAKWTVKMSGVLQDGRRAAATQVITKIDKDKATFQTVGREVDGELLPSSPAVTVVRVASSDVDANSSLGDVAVPTASSADSAAPSDNPRDKNEAPAPQQPAESK